MEPPTITKKQEKKALSGKKPKKETIKNVLAKPFKSYWPLLTPEDNNHLKETLTRLLPRLKNDRIKVPYSKIKEIPKCERKKFREQHATLEPLEVNETDRQSLIFGVNDVARLLEHREARSVLIASDVEPRLFVQHVLDQAVLYNVPVLVVTDLREVLKMKCGLSGAVIGLKNTIKPDCQLGLIQQTICNIYENYPVPETHVHYHRRQLKDASTIIISDNEDSVMDKSKSVIFVSDSDDEREIACKNHLRRGDKKRVFVPEKSEPSAKSTTFMHLESSSCVSNINNNGIHYQSLQVKRIRGDKNRNKRKMERFKKK
ncbi:uncharacterized protein BDFB_001708 [Asbolus verrucosus]|uniref:Ribosomal protein eL8/eL30/eS12/Gadd45 domain-containing protein n=1 Tax=Asbolus verrucosus TaxID=1661398 RepID=A0A482VKC1_ASBVE|nr:uncharacterized protein BDFB_001708 [Asbolus verrucosus]